MSYARRRWPCSQEEKQRMGERDKGRVHSMCRRAVTLRLNAKTFSFFLSLSVEAKEGGEFMALQLLSLVTVNWLLSEAVRVFYGRPFVPGLCLGSHLWGEQSYRRPRRRSLLPLKPQPEDYWRWHFSVLSANRPASQLPPSLLGPYLSIHLWASRGTGTKATAPLLSVGLGVLLFLFIKGDFEWHCTTERVPQPQKTCAFTLKSHRSPRNTLMDEGKKEKGFSNNLSKVLKTLLTVLRQSCIAGLFVCMFVITGLFLPILV